MFFSPLDSAGFNTGFTGRSLGRVQAAAVHPIDPDAAWALVRPIAGRSNPAASLVRPLHAAPSSAKVTPL